jgi:hypothetical protein
VVRAVAGLGSDPDAAPPMPAAASSYSSLPPLPVFFSSLSPMTRSTGCGQILPVELGAALAEWYSVIDLGCQPLAA